MYNGSYTRVQRLDAEKIREKCNNYINFSVSTSLKKRDFIAKG